MRVETDGFAFDFKNALDAFVFDETDRTKPNYHGLPMKAVDVVAEFDKAYIHNALRRELPVGRASTRWKRAIVKSCQVLNLGKWNENFPQWPVSRIVKDGK